MCGSLHPSGGAGSWHVRPAGSAQEVRIVAELTQGQQRGVTQEVGVVGVRSDRRSEERMTQKVGVVGGWK